MIDLVLVLTTAPDAIAETIARALVTESLAACVNVHAPMTSFYRWRGAVERDAERQLVIKTTRVRVPEVRERIAALHTYELPEFLVVDVADGAAEYLDWVAASVAVRVRHKDG